MEKRTLLAFALAPALVPGCIIILMLFQRFHAVLPVAGIYAAFTYGATLVFGIPMHLFLSRRSWNAWWHYALGGAGIGLAVLLFFVVMNPYGSFKAASCLLFTGLGMASTSLFWLIGVRRDVAEDSSSAGPASRRRSET